MVAKSRSEYICFMGRGVDMRGVPSRDDGVQLVGGRVGGGGAYRWNRVRPAFMEPLGVPPPNGGYGVGVRGDDGSLRMMRKRSSSFPIKDDAGYIGYLSDDDTGSGGDEGIISSTRNMVRRQRRELLGIDGDISFSMCCLLVVIVLMMAVAVAVAVLR
jgi:hypothetical protein